MSDQHMQDIAQRVRFERLKAGLTQTQLAERIGISYPRISDIETAKGNPQMHTFLALATAFGLDPSQLFRQLSNREEKQFAKLQA